MKTTFDSDNFVNAHGREPKGRGMWAFSIDGTDGHGRWTSLEACAFFTGTLTEGKRQAKEHGKQLAAGVGGIRELYIRVLS